MANITYFDGAKVAQVGRSVKNSLLVDSSSSEWQWTPLPLKAEAEPGIAPADAYLAVGDIFRGTQIRANAVAKMPKHFYEINGGNELEVGDPKLAVLGNFTDTLWRITSSLLFYGASYLAKLDKNSGTMRWFNSATIYPKWLPLEGLTGFSRAAPGQNFFGLDAMCYIWYPSPFTELGPGPGAARVAMEEAGVVRGVNKALTAYFERGMIQPILLYSEEALSPDQKNDLKAWFQRMISGVKRAFSIEIASRKLTKLDLSSSLKDAYPPGIRQEMCESIAKTLGIPMSLLFSNAANYATAQQDEKNLYNNAAIPDAELIQEQLNRQVFRYFGFELHFAPKELECFQENTQQKSQGLSNLIAGGVPIDIAMEHMGYELDEEDDARVRLIALMKQGASYDDACTYILADANPLEIERVQRVLDLFKPKSEPKTPIQQLAELPVAQPPAAQPPPPPPEPPIPPVKADLLMWERFALKRVKAGKPLREFESAVIPASMRGAISGALESATDVNAVRNVFRQAITWSEYP
jgi:hypothetical protein